MTPIQNGHLWLTFPQKLTVCIAPTDHVHSCVMFYPSVCAAELRRQERLVHRNKLKQDPALAAQLAESRLQPVTYREASPTLAPAIQVCPAGIGIVQLEFVTRPGPGL